MKNRKFYILNVDYSHDYILNEVGGYTEDVQLPNCNIALTVEYRKTHKGIWRMTDIASGIDANYA